MMQAAWMAGVSVAAWLAASVVTDRTTSIELFLGMLAPLVVACTTWVMVERTHRRNPQAVTGLLLAGFAFKLVLFGGYVAVMLRVLHLRPVPFTVSFSSYFIVLHFVEALFLRRLFAGAPRA